MVHGVREPGNQTKSYVQSCEQMVQKSKSAYKESSIQPLKVNAVCCFLWEKVKKQDENSHKDLKTSEKVCG